MKEATETAANRYEWWKLKRSLLIANKKNGLTNYGINHVH